MRIRFILQVLLLTALTILLAACGGNDDDTAIEVGATAPDFSLTNATGGSVSLSDYDGKPVLLYFHMAVG